MKKFTLVLILALVLGGAAFAQQGSDFTSPQPQFVSFDLGAGFGYSASNTANYRIGSSQMGGVLNFGLRISLLQNFGVGFDSLMTVFQDVATNRNLFSGLRLSFNFIPQAGASLGIGVTQIGSTTAAAAPALSMGLYGDLFQTRSAAGITSGLKLRIDYIARASDIDKGTITFTPSFSFGL